MTRRVYWRLFVVLTLLAMVGGAAFTQWRAVAGGVAGSRAEDRPDPCLPGRAVPIMDSPHVSEAEIGAVRYNSVPPTSGPHLAFVLAPGVYDGPVPDGLTVHAMEHGHVVVHYAPDAPSSDVDGLRRLARQYSRDVLLAPYPGLPYRIAVTAWGRIDTLDTLDEPRISRFVEALRARYNHGWTRPPACSGP